MLPILRIFFFAQFKMNKLCVDPTIANQVKGHGSELMLYQEKKVKVERTFFVVTRTVEVDVLFLR